MSDESRDATSDSGRETPLDAALQSALESRADGAALRAVYHTVPATDASVTAAQRDAAWTRLRSRLHDPARVRFTDDVRPPLELVRDDDVPLAAASTAPADTPRRPASHGAPVVAPGARAAAARTGTARARAAFAAAAALVATLLSAAWANGTVAHRVAEGGAPKSWQLADGSRVWLAPGSAVTHSRRLGWPAPFGTDRRSLQLVGEAYLEVARDGRPFDVRTPSLQVQVLGTRFAVRSGDAHAAPRVQVNEGRVAVLAGDRRTELAAGDVVVLRAGTVRRSRIDPTRVATWRTGGLVAIDEPLGEVLQELSRRHAVEITVAANVDSGALVSLVYASAPELSTVLGDLCLAQGLAFERTSRGYRVVRP